MLYLYIQQLPLSGVQPHSDGRNFVLTGHLGLRVPKEGDCWMKVCLWCIWCAYNVLVLVYICIYIVVFRICRIYPNTLHLHTQPSPPITLILPISTLLITGGW